MNTEEQKLWLEERRQGIGGSDAPVCYLGEYYGKTWADLYREKVMGVETPDNAHMRRGRRQEPVAAQVMEEALGQPLVPVKEILHHRGIDWMRASLDRRLVDGTPVEIKCPSVGSFLRMRKAGLDPGHLVQGQHYLAVTGAKKIIFGVFCAELDELMVGPRETDPELIQKMVDRD